MDNKLIIDRILSRIDRFDDKLDANMCELKDKITTCKLDIQSVQKDLINHLNNKRNESERSNRQFYIVTAVIGVMVSIYVTIKELF